MEFAWFKGHGTENDFVVLPDHDGTVHGDLDPAFVAALCDRRRGIGADGVMRVVRCTALGHNSPAEWFMDYRNADGSLSQMCGNGIRVFARHLLEQGLVEGPEFPIDTRDGLKFLSVDGDELSVDMGAWTTGTHTKVTANDRTWEALEVHTGNPHAVAFVDSLADAGTLIEAPHHDESVYPEGVNVEFVQRIAPQHVAMRVHERGSGETRSCGTGACATAIATAKADRESGPATYRVDVPGGTLHVTVSPDRTVLTGPAVIVAGGTMEWSA
ncbi:diaminopimelate epimerase [Aeromicrobium duanguangcaii]|uniref:Diaminopimelate epimerase n=1 Tax=Aeromicrobium duanguangcaii TaxID=2968086 RepID=A0ABY5KGT8_9ACTN|nr:diaminopimelate epimerase [Aeromicrobium duanguangcaii]MCD9153213.1 diaminopimelate epimerase [Aeromicrobium duanguangcaii]MCL3836794.1 diaminopimelate epimerase [Aeromicrobium duanguangcaii]UUI69687.1 diaminopimelate epimerase [Aeromicrobium duanguangcaii]